MIPNLKVLILEKSKKGKEGLIIAVPELWNYTAQHGQTTDAIHVCIAMHEDFWFITKDDRIGKLKELYPKIEGMKGFMGIFDKLNRL